MNPILNELQNNQMQQLMKLWQMSQAMQNPEQYLMQQLSQNSKYGEIFKLLQQNNGNFEKTVYDYAKAQGGDPNQFINSLKQSMGLK